MKKLEVRSFADLSQRELQKHKRHIGRINKRIDRYKVKTEKQ